MLRVRTAKTAKRASVSFVSAYSTHSQKNVAANEGPAGSIVRDANSADSADSSPESNRTTPETLRVGTAKTDKRWDRETAALIEWFAGTTPPAGPFELRQAVTIARPDAYWEYLKGYIAAGPNWHSKTTCDASIACCTTVKILEAAPHDRGPGHGRRGRCPEDPR